MINKINFNSKIFVIPSLVLLTLVTIVKSSIFINSSEQLYLATTADFLITIPFIYYILIRKKNIPKTTVIPVFGFCLLIARNVLPDVHQHILLDIQAFVLPVVEIFVLVVIGVKVKKIKKNFNIKKGEGDDYYSLIKESLIDTVPKKLVPFMATEISMFYYGFFNWRKRVLKKNEFSYHVGNGSIALLLVFLLLIIIETIVLHIILQLWSGTAAWIISGISIYSLFMVYGFTRSLPKRPIIVGERKLFLRYGIFSETEIPYKLIDNIKISSKWENDSAGQIKLSPLGELEKHNVVLKLKNENILFFLYGFTKPYKSISFFVDDKIAFLREVLEKLDN